MWGENSAFHQHDALMQYQDTPGIYTTQELENAPVLVAAVISFLNEQFKNGIKTPRGK